MRSILFVFFAVGFGIISPVISSTWPQLNLQVAGSSRRHPADRNGAGHNESSRHRHKRLQHHHRRRILLRKWRAVPGLSPSPEEQSESTSRPAQMSNQLSDLLTEQEEAYLREITSGVVSPASDGDHLRSISPPTPSQQPEQGIVTKFLQLVESQQRLGENCTAGTEFKLEGVVDSYGQERFRPQAELTVKRANLLTWLWKFAPESMLNERLLQALVLSLVESDENIFAAGNCYDGGRYKHYHLFCPFAHRLPSGDSILVKDLATEYQYLGNTSEWFWAPRKRAEELIEQSRANSTLRYRVYTINYTTSDQQRMLDEIQPVSYGDGYWSLPYFDCGGGNIWMMTYTIPFFGYEDGRYFFQGTSGIDIDLRRVDIDQCPQRRNSSEVNIFASSDKCKTATTKCIHVAGLGFRRGSYRCECREGFFYPGPGPQNYFNGSIIEDVYESKLQGLSSQYDELGVFECVPCAEGCRSCSDGKPCLLSLNWAVRTAILVLSAIIIGLLPFVVFFTIRYGEIKVVRAASPVLLRIIVLGALFVYTTTLVLYPQPNTITCTLRFWLREIGFSLSYGALMLKTWRISIIFRVKSAKAVKITDLDLMRRLGCLVGGFTSLLAIRTIVSPPPVMVVYSADGLKAFLCHTDWWDHTFSAIELLFLVWGIRLCIVVRKAPSEFNESKFISLSIYNEFLLTILLNISTLFLKSPANPDLLYIIFFLHNQLTMTVLLVLIFGSKVYLVWKGQGRLETSLTTSKSTGAKFQRKRMSEDLHTLSGSANTNRRSIIVHRPLVSAVQDRDVVQGNMERLTTELEQLLGCYRDQGDLSAADRVRAMLDAGRDQLTAAELSRAVIVSPASPQRLQGLLSRVTDQLVSSVVPQEPLSAAAVELPEDHLQIVTVLPTAETEETRAQSVQTCHRRRRHAATQTLTTSRPDSANSCSSDSCSESSCRRSSSGGDSGSNGDSANGCTCRCHRAVTPPLPLHISDTLDRLAKFTEEVAV